MKAIPRCLVIAVVGLAVVAMMAPDTAAQRKRKGRDCLDCHETFKEHLDKRFKHGPMKDGCETCHARHGFQEKLVLVKNPPGLCTECHENVGDEISGDGVHEALSKGGCTVCHDPHASDNPALMRDVEAGSTICVLCHDGLSDALAEEKAHEPFAKRDCAACHAPHASAYGGLLSAAETDVCARCHENVATMHTMPGWDDFDCGDCHDPHTASGGAPLSSLAHDPFASGDCADCHTIEEGEITIGDDFPGADLCAGCHDDVADRVAHAEGHFGMNDLSTGGTETCLECHDPHASGTPKMLIAEQNELCRRCHTMLPSEARFKGPMHEPFADGECVTCHDPHGGGGEVHLSKEQNQLCSSCHQPFLDIQAKGSTQHAALDESDCVDCHSGHASETPGLLVEGFGETCLTCHEKSQHAASHPPYLTSSCEACHRNHSPNPNLLVADVNRTCGQCHQQQLRAIGWPNAHEAASDDDCMLCHAPHGSDNEGLLVQEQGELCSDCHDVDALVVGPDTGVKLHQPVADGGCSGCHDPHGTMLPGLIKREGQELCYGCHTNERVSFAEGNVHEPVVDGACASCHAAHGSAQANLAIQPEPELCIQCHDLSKAPVGTHAGFDVTGSRCSSCHTPHASRGEHLLNEFVHDPFAERDCEACHDGSAPSPGAVASVSADACLLCHDEKEADKGHQHEEDLACATCHEPHSARFEPMLADPEKTCTGCHAEDLGLAAAGVEIHQPIVAGSCLDCHMVHDAPAGGYLAMNQFELCSSCHESIASSVNDKTKHKPFGQGKCSKCHETHASTERHLLAKSEKDLCVSCHSLSSTRMASSHGKIPLTGKGCATCHDPHSTPAANTSLVYANLHSPYEDGDCDACHDSDGSLATTVDVCADCHDSDSDFAAVHGGGREGEDRAELSVCMDCHSPHAGHDALLVRTSQRETCLQCHNRVEFSRRQMHGALEEGCTACHDMHDSNIEMLRGVEGDNKCKSCHDGASMHAHPLGKDFKDPRTGDPLRCLSCHEPHSSDHEFIVTFDHKRDLCVQCHASGTMKVQGGNR